MTELFLKVELRIISKSAVGNQEDIFCGGSIITRDRILTAGHCIERVNRLSQKLISKKVALIIQLYIYNI